MTTSAQARVEHNSVAEIRRYGQSVWLDFIRRGLIAGGELQRLVSEDGLAGVTSNPAIFEQAIDGSDEYVRAIADLAGDPPASPKRVYEQLAMKDVRDAADVLLPVHEWSAGRDGYVSLEVAPDLAHDAEGTIAEARRLWAEVGRQNVMIKVPGTPEGIQAVHTLLFEGINVNVTLLFARSVYERTAEVFLEALEARIAAGRPIAHVASVASFFVSRIDTAVDALLNQRIASAPEKGRPALEALLGRAAIANAKSAYQSYKRLFSGPRWEALRARGAQPQRLLWASTGVKSPYYRDVRYVEELIGPDTVTTVPPETLLAFRAHGRARPSLEEKTDEAFDVLARLVEAGISLTKVTDDLLTDGIERFRQPWSKLLGTVGRRVAEARLAGLNPQRYSIGSIFGRKLADRLASWDDEGGTRRIWEGDASIWSGSDESRWLGWIDVAGTTLGGLDALRHLRDELRNDGFTHVLLLGMGGSSLAPDVLRETFGNAAGSPALLVLDSTDPAQLTATERRIDLLRTLFVVSSKSGTTLEPNLFRDYFLDRVRHALGPAERAEAGRRFIAITDPGSELEKQAMADGFRYIAHGEPSIGGRYSALTHFGMLPATLLGLDVERLLRGAQRMLNACAPGIAAADNPGLVLGTLLGLAARDRIDKLTLTASPGLVGFGAWVEQLLAESTGKRGTGIIPVDREHLGPPEIYGNDRLFVYLRLDEAPDAAQDAAVETLEQAGRPVIRIGVPTRYDLGQEFGRWEVATAVAGAILHINPFDQPDVEASKVASRVLTAAYEKTGRFPEEAPFFQQDGVSLFADGANTFAVRNALRGRPTLATMLRAHLDRLRLGDYAALLAYLPADADTQNALDLARHRIRDRKAVATCLGFGPRFLHSTGQVYKGGPATGLFLQITCDDPEDVPVPGQKYTFGVVKAAQAQGDFQVLAERQRRALRVHLGPDVARGLATLNAAIAEALPRNNGG